MTSCEQTPVDLRAHSPETHKPRKYLGLTGPLWIATLIPSLQYFVDGYNLGVINNSRDAVQEFFEQEGYPISRDDWATFASIYTIGTLGSFFLAIAMSKAVPPVKVLSVNNINYFLGSAFIFLASRFPAKGLTLLCVARFVQGFGSGLCYSFGSVYLHECSPPAIRGALVTGLVASLITGILVAYILGMNGVMGTSSLWVPLYMLGAAPLLVHVFIVRFAPESPRYLALAGKGLEAYKSLVRLQGRRDADKEWPMIEASLNNNPQSSHIEGIKAAARKLFTTRAGLKPLAIMIVLPILGQLSFGLWLIYYSESIFQTVGLKDGELATVLQGLVDLLATFVLGWLIERLGRRGTMFWSALIGIPLSVIFVFASINSENDTWNRVGLVVVLLYIAIVGVFATLCGMIGPELFPNDVRSFAIPLISIISRTFAYANAKMFLTILDAMGDYLFCMCAAVCTLGALFAYFIVPETKGLALEEVQETMHAKKGQKGGREAAGATENGDKEKDVEGGFEQGEISGGVFDARNLDSGKVGREERVVGLEGGLDVGGEDDGNVVVVDCQQGESSIAVAGRKNGKGGKGVQM